VTRLPAIDTCRTTSHKTKATTLKYPFSMFSIQAETHDISEIKTGDNISFTSDTMQVDVEKKTGSAASVVTFTVPPFPVDLSLNSGRASSTNATVVAFNQLIPFSNFVISGDSINQSGTTGFSISDDMAVLINCTFTVTPAVDPQSLTFTAEPFSVTAPFVVNDNFTVTCCVIAIGALSMGDVIQIRYNGASNVTVSNRQISVQQVRP
jgi:hypothetical protein